MRLHTQYQLVQRFNAAVTPPPPLLMNGTAPRLNGPTTTPPSLPPSRAPGSSPSSFSPSYPPPPPNSFLSSNPMLGAAGSPLHSSSTPHLPSNQQHSSIIGQPLLNNHHPAPSTMSPVFNPPSCSSGPPPGWPSFNNPPPLAGNKPSAFSAITSE